MPLPAKERTFIGQLRKSYFAIVVLLLHNLNDAEEILQDTLLQYLRKAPSFESDEHEKAWLLRVAGNLSKNRLNYNKVRYTDELEETLIADKREDLSFV